MKGKVVAIGVLWMLAVLLSFAWNYHSARSHETQSMLAVSRAFFDQIVLARSWNAEHGGLYTYVSVSTPPNPYLKKHPERDIILPNGRMLTLINPAYMTRQISELARKENGLQFHITSLNPVRPENGPFAWERKILESFERGVKEKGAFFKGGYRYMAPLITQQSCLQCHGDNYRLGEIRGGISVTLPGAHRASVLPLITGHLLIALAGLLLVGLVGAQLQRTYRMLQQQSVIDSLTGVANRRYFMEQVEKEYRRANRMGSTVALIMADIDFFKLYNDYYGHLEGDNCLKQVAEAMQKVIKRPGDFLARYGGEEFVIILPETPLPKALYVAEQLREAVEELQLPHAVSRSGKVVSISLGVAAATPKMASYEALIRQADRAMYRAKQQGRNRIAAQEMPPEETSGISSGG